MNFSNQIRKMYGSLSVGDQEIVDKIQKNMDRVAFLSITDFASEVHSSKSSVSRLAQKLGYRGFSDMKFAMQQELSMPRDVPHNMTEAYKKEVLSHFTLAEQFNFQPLMQKIQKAERFVLFSTGSTQSHYARQLSNDFFLAGRPNFFLDSFPDMNLLARTLGEKDLVLIISFSGSSHGLDEIINSLKLNKTPIASITELGTNPLSQATDYALYFHAVPLPYENVYSLAGIGIILSILSRKYMEYVLFDE